MKKIKQKAPARSAYDILVADPFRYLEDDHRSIEKLFKKMEETGEHDMKTREELCEALNAALTRHAEVEERYLYPTLEAIDETRAEALEAADDHATVKTMLRELVDTPPDTDEWMPKLMVLKENVSEHVQEEERELFRKAQTALTAEEIDQIRQNMEDFLQGQ